MLLCGWSGNKDDLIVSYFGEGSTLQMKRDALGTSLNHSMHAEEDASEDTTTPHYNKLAIGYY